MNQIKSFGLVATFLGMFLLSSCETEDPVKLDVMESEKIETLKDTEINQVEMAKEFSQVLGQVLQSRESRLELTSLVKKVDSYGDVVTLAAILGSSSQMGSSELLALRSLDQDLTLRKSISHLSETLLDHTLANISNYKLIERSFDSYMAAPQRKNAKTSTKDALKEFYASQGLVVHIPYEEKFDWTSGFSEITTTYDPLIREDWNEGFVYNSSSSGRVTTTNGRVIKSVDDQYSYLNPTFVITYYNEEDFMSTPPNPTLPTQVPNAVRLNIKVLP